MGRKRVVDGIRMDFWMEREDVKALEEKKEATGMNIAEQVRLAVRDWLGKDPVNSGMGQYNIHKPSKEVIDVLKYLSQMLPEGRHLSQTIDLKKDPMMLLFSKEWFKLKQMMEMTVEVLRVKVAPDIIFEEDTYLIEVPGTTRTRQHRAGFKIDFGKKIGRVTMESLICDLEKEIKAHGKITISRRKQS